MAATDIGTGASLTFSSGLAAEIRDMQMSGVERGAHDAPNMADTNVFTRVIGRLASPPVLTVEINLDPDADWITAINAAAATVTITFPTPQGGISGATWSFTGALTGYEAGIPVEDIMTATLTITATTMPVKVNST